MPYVVLNEEGHILSVHADAVDGAVEVSPDDPALKEFILRNHPDMAQREDWVQADLALARVMEDLIDVLIEKGVIMFTDFPEGAQKKLLARRGMRKEFAYVQNLFVDEDGGAASGGGGDGSGNQGGGFL
ncbi:MAG: hypothetical protein FJX42_02515 [Alphaproteobacteria bacterium]|nr:hypothetical protein [Alphaproteobacteria bacterium]